jgi:hypothetical protein
MALCHFLTTFSLSIFYTSNGRAQRRGRAVADVRPFALSIEKRKELLAPSVCSEWLARLRNNVRPREIFLQLGYNTLRAPDFVWDRKKIHPSGKDPTNNKDTESSKKEGC